MLKNLLLFVILILFLFSCKKNDVIISTVDTSINDERLVVVYMVADNNLDYFAVQNINEMEMGFDSASFNGKLLVYVDRGANAKPSHPYMMEIVHDTTNAIVSKIIYTYPEQNTAQGYVLTSVIQDAKKYYSNYTNIGLVLWSHGTSWLPKGVQFGTKRGQIIDSTKSFGLDNNPFDSSVLDIKDLKFALKNTKNKFDFILFDACYMNSIEVAYELKDYANYMIASPSEILSYGFPYKKIVPLLGQNNLDIQAITNSFYNFYQAQKGILQTATVAAINLNNIIDLASKTNTLFTSLSKIKDTFKIQLHNIQRLDYSGDSSSMAWAFDLYHFLQYNFENSTDTEISMAYKNIQIAWGNTVFYSQHTNMLFKTINLNNCNGISTYIPNALNNKIADDYYKTLQWYQQSGYNKIVFAPY